MAYLQHAGVRVSEEEMCRLVAEKLAARVIEQQAQIKQLQQQSNPLPPATSKKARSKAKAKAARAAAKRDQKMRRKRVAALAQPVARSPPARGDKDVWASPLHANAYGEGAAYKHAEDLLIANLQKAEAEAEAYRNDWRHEQEYGYARTHHSRLRDDSDVTVVDRAVESSFALRSAGERLNRRSGAPRSKEEIARRRRASSHAGFGAVGVSWGQGGRSVAALYRTQTTSSLLKATENRVQRLQRLLSHLGQQRARIKAELEAQRSYLASIAGDLTQGRGARRTVRLRHSTVDNQAKC